MEKETWKEFRIEAYLSKLYPGNIRTPNIQAIIYWRSHSRIQWRAVKFIEKLLQYKVSLDDININDFSSAYPCRVYVGNRSYIRFAPSDYKLALKYIKGRVKSN